MRVAAILLVAVLSGCIGDESEGGCVSELCDAPTAEFGVLRTVAVDGDYVPIPGVTMTAVSEDGNTTESMLTDADGKAHFLNMSVGTYNVTASSEGWSTGSEQGIVDGSETPPIALIQLESVIVYIEPESWTFYGNNSFGFSSEHLFTIELAYDASVDITADWAATGGVTFTFILDDEETAGQTSVDATYALTAGTHTVGARASSVVLQGELVIGIEADYN